MTLTPEQVATMALTEAREPEYHVAEQEDYDDAEIVVTALRGAGYIKDTPTFNADVPELEKEEWLSALEILFARLPGIGERDIANVMAEARAIFRVSENAVAAKELNERARLFRIGGTTIFDLNEGQVEAISVLFTNRATELSGKG